ncbi:hypothetical protein B0H13DRAFT_2301172 [Mycena leptocephala]|nr:hypothetical protein B0H13DRAFT_2301172 [Mycena leptocephala]
MLVAATQYYGWTCACMRFAPPHKLVTRTLALDDAHQSVDTLGMFARGGWFVLAASVLGNLFAFAVHKRLTLTPALDDAHQSIDTLGMLLRWGRFVLAVSVLSNLFAFTAHRHLARCAPCS